MTVNTLVVDEEALIALDAALIEEIWFDNFDIPKNVESLRRIYQGDVVYLLSKSAEIDSALLVVNVGDGGVFSKSRKRKTLFERVMRVGLRQFDRSITLPVLWQSFHEGSRLSVYADRYSKGDQTRILFEQAPDKSENIYAFAATEGPTRLDDVSINLDRYRSAVEGYLDALVCETPSDANGGNFGIVLSQPLGVQLAGSGTLDEWVDRRLSDEQLGFVRQPQDRPIRLRGAAGTGKTQAMAVKCLHGLFADAGSDKTVAFLTHSSALAHEVVRGMFCALDPSERWATLKTPSGSPKLWIGTLYELAQQLLEYERKGLRPLSLDGRDGRELQRLLIQDAIKEARKDARIAISMSSECPDLAARLSNEETTNLFVEELMNEFACILDADSIIKGTTEAERYVRAPRESWQMNLPSPAHRQIALEIHDIYCRLLRDDRFLSMDQMIGDFGRYLTTNEWKQQLRDRDGFDIIFIDEYHYFTRMEAMILQSLFKTRAGKSGRWPLIMAYDLKQSTSDAALGGGIERFRNPGVGESVPVDLTRVYRSTPQIADFLRDLDGCFPSIDLEGEFNPYSAKSAVGDGDIPTLIEFETNVKLVDSVFDMAMTVARTLQQGGRQVAVLCLNEHLFDQYRSAGRIEGKFVAITSREDLRDLRYAGNRCVFSMPEYVAGLQFDTVFLIQADRSDLAVDHLSQGARRRYVSRVYLGASRAARRLVVVCSRERGGPSELVDVPLRTGSLKKQTVESLVNALRH